MVRTGVWVTPDPLTSETTMEMIVKLDFFPGYKTYIIGAVMVVFGALSGLTPELLTAVSIDPSGDAPRTIMEGLMVLTGRRAIQRLES